MLPIARIDGLIVEHVGAETVVYDTASHRVHSLNRTTSFVWQQCDGRTTAEEIVRRLADHLGLPPDPDIVRMALRQLSRAELLASKSADIVQTLPSRRELARRLTLAGASAAALVPAITSILAPTPSMAKSYWGGHDNGEGTAWGKGGSKGKK